MALFTLFLIIIAILTIIFFIIALFYTLTKKEFPEVARSALRTAIFVGVFGAGAGVLLSLFAVFNIGFSGLLATVVLGIYGFFGTGIITWIFAFIYQGLPEKLRTIILYVIIIPLILAFLAVVIWGLYIAFSAGTLPEYIKFASPLFEGAEKGLSELAKFRYCLYADVRCPFFVSWEDPNIQSAIEEFAVDASFSEKRILDDSINVLVSLSIKNPDLAELRIKPKCYLKKEKEIELEVANMGSYALGDEFVFPTSSQGRELHTTFRCVGEVPEAAGKNIFSEDLVVELERPVSVKTIWPVWLGSQPHLGIIRSEMKYNAPYMVSLGSNNDMPFKEGKEYDFQLTIKRRDDDAKLKNIEKISIIFPDDILANCEFFDGIDHELEFREYDYETLKNLVQYDKEFDKFIFPCSLYVTRAPTQAVMDSFEVKAYYTVYSDYKTKVVKSF